MVVRNRTIWFAKKFIRLPEVASAFVCEQIVGNGNSCVNKSWHSSHSQAVTTSNVATALKVLPSSFGLVDKSP